MNDYIMYYVFLLNFFLLMHLFYFLQESVEFHLFLTCVSQYLFHTIKFSCDFIDCFQFNY